MSGMRKLLVMPVPCPCASPSPVWTLSDIHARCLPNQVARRNRQVALPLPQWGGRRKGAGRKPKGRRALVSHKARPRFDKPSVVHLTFRVHDDVWNLRSQRCFRLVEPAFDEARGRYGVRIVEFAVLGNHLHLLAEADDSELLSRAMKGLLVRLARALNGLMGRKGALFADHHHSRLLRTPSEVAHAFAYVLDNSAHHYGGAADADPFSSAQCDRERVLSRPTTWLLCHGWKRARRRPVRKAGAG